jgi:hypothetical protein
MNTVIIKILRWAARIISISFVLLFIIMSLGIAYFSNANNDKNPLQSFSIIQLSILAIGLLGLIIAWKWEILGAILSLLTYVILAFENQDFVYFSSLWILPLSALLFIFAAAFDKQPLNKF